ncbi:hypothetical protein SEVIR_2G353750v4 [Setaria viridis]
MAAGKGDVEGGCPGGGGADRISGLPDHLLHSILLLVPGGTAAGAASGPASPNSPSATDSKRPCTRDRTSASTPPWPRTPRRPSAAWRSPCPTGRPTSPRTASPRGYGSPRGASPATSCSRCRTACRTATGKSSWFPRASGSRPCTSNTCAARCGSLQVIRVPLQSAGGWQDKPHRIAFT